MDQKEIDDLLVANSRRAIMENQLSLAKSMRDIDLRVGYKGGLFEASLSFLVALKYQITEPGKWGAVLLDMNDIPIGLNAAELIELHNRCSVTHDAVMRAYYANYTRIVGSTKEDLVKELGETVTET